MATLYLPKTRKILKPRTKRLVLNRRVWEAEGLVGFWPLGTYPDGRDMSLYGNHGDIVSHPVHSGSGNRFGLDFDGSDDYVDAGNVADALASMTVSLWINPSTQGAAYRDVISKWNTGTYGWWLEIPDTTSTKIAYGNGGGSYTETTNSEMTKDVWNHVVIRHQNDGAIHEIYVNGTNVVVTDAGGGAGAIGSQPAVPLRIGGNNNTSRYFDGLLDDIRIYNRPFSAQEVSSLYRTTAPGGYGRLLRPAPSVFRIPLAVGAAFAGRNQILGGGVI